MSSKRIIHILLFSIVSLASFFNQILAQDAIYQDKQGPVPLYFSSEKISIKFTSQGADVAGFVASNPAFDPNKPPQPTIYGFYLLFLVPEVNVASLLNELDTNSQVEIANPVYWQQDSTDIIPCDRVTVKFKSNLTRSVVDSLNQANGVTIIDSIKADSNWVVVQVTRQTGQSVLEIANTYEQSTYTDYAVPVFDVEGHYRSPLPPDPYFYYQWNYHNTGQVLAGGTSGTPDADIDTPEAWEFGLGDPNFVVAVIDAGVEGHEDMPASKLFKGYDYAGNDLTNPNNTSDSDPSPGHDPCPFCFCAHGMPVAGLIAASQNNIGVSGISPNIKIMPLKNADNTGRFAPPVVQAQCITYAVDSLSKLNQKYPIANNSWGYDYILDTLPESIMRVKDIKFAIQYASKSMLMIFATAENGSFLGFPENMKEVIAVGATDRFDWRVGYSPRYKTIFSDSIDLVAPSGCGTTQGGDPGDIWSLDIEDFHGWDDCLGIDPPVVAPADYVTRFAGTSASAPQVAGVAALLMSYANKSTFRQNLTLNDYREILKHSSQDQVGPTEPLCDGWVTCSFNGGCVPTEFIDEVGWDRKYGYGRLNAMQAMVEVARGDVTKDSKVTIADMNFLINYLFHGGPAPTPLRSLGDVNCDGVVTLGDISYLTNYLFHGGPAPAIHCYRFY